MRKILIADDDSEDRMMLIEALHNHGQALKIMTVTNGREVLDYLTGCAKENLPEIMILDYKMPFLGAAQVLETIQREKLYQDIVKIVWSTSQQPEHIQRCLQAGAQRYFVKPSHIKELDNITKAILEISDAG